MSLHFCYRVWNHVHQWAHGSWIRCFLVAPYCPLLVLWWFTCARGEAWKRSHSIITDFAKFSQLTRSVTPFSVIPLIFVTYCFKGTDTADSSLPDHPSFFEGFAHPERRFWWRKRREMPKRDSEPDPKVVPKLWHGNHKVHCQSLHSGQLPTPSTLEPVPALLEHTCMT